ncbi:hypothetical protein QBC34DRAFT_223737 [Podospora aff. communis PSN243]|uniref:N-acetyltransferase domain-containing protein n=1 Tax=Podospora aff. communis PSN243 TaxID=3040156 RepID=A0AAV9G3W2_9PEZI|nr:hypothetical protein QBC34DRAFT_223737 [Podospora aff. communis PSN243]
MTTITPTFRIRDAVPSPANDDALFIAAAFDSCIPHLATIGSATQWGTEPISERPNFHEQRTSSIAEAAEYLRTGAGKPVRVLIIDAETPSGGWVPVGSSTLRGNYFSKYLLEQKHLEHETKREGNWMFLEVLVTSFSEEARPYRKGAGAALVKHAKAWAEELGMDVMFVDCWAGNEGKLVKFYEAQGFEKVDGFEVERPDGRDPWPGMFLRMDIGKSDDALSTKNTA